MNSENSENWNAKLKFIGNLNNIIWQLEQYCTILYRQLMSMQYISIIKLNILFIATIWSWSPVRQSCMSQTKFIVSKFCHHFNRILSKLVLVHLHTPWSTVFEYVLIHLYFAKWFAKVAICNVEYKKNNWSDSLVNNVNVQKIIGKIHVMKKKLSHIWCQSIQILFISSKSSQWCTIVWSVMFSSSAGCCCCSCSCHTELQFAGNLSGIGAYCRF